MPNTKGIDISKISSLNSSISKMSNRVNSKQRAISSKPANIDNLVREVQSRKNNKINKRNVNESNTIIKNISTLSGSVVSQTKKFSEMALKNLKEISSNSLRAIGEMSSEMIDEMKESIQFNKQGFVVGLFSTINPLLGHALGKIVDSSAFQNTFGVLKEKISNIFSKITDSLKSTFLNIWRSIKEKTSRLWDGFKSFLGFSSAKEKKRRETDNDEIKINKKSLKKIPKLAKGGIIGNEGLAYVHKAEVVGSIGKLKSEFQSAISSGLTPFTTFFKELKHSKNYYKREDSQKILVDEVILMRKALISKMSHMQIAWQNTLSKHPVFRKLVSAFGILTFPIRVIFRKKGTGYLQDVKNKNLTQIMGVLYINQMTRLDRLIELSTDTRTALYDIAQFTTGIQYKGSKAKKLETKKKSIADKTLFKPFTSYFKNYIRASQINSMRREGASQEEIEQALSEMSDKNNLMLAFMLSSGVGNNILSRGYSNVKMGIKKGIAYTKGFLHRSLFGNQAQKTFEDLQGLKKLVEKPKRLTSIDLSQLQVDELKKLVSISENIEKNTLCGCENMSTMVRFISDKEETGHGSHGSLIKKLENKSKNQDIIITKDQYTVRSIEKLTDLVTSNSKKELQILSDTESYTQKLFKIEKRRNKGFFGFLFNGLFGITKNIMGGMSSIISTVFDKSGIPELLKFVTGSSLGLMLAKTLKNLIPKSLLESAEKEAAKVAEKTAAKGLGSVAEKTVGKEGLRVAEEAGVKATEKTVGKEGLKIAENAGVKAAEKMGLKFAGEEGIKSVAKKIPVVGALIGAAMAIYDLYQGKPLLAIADLASGIISTLPGGFLASIGIDILSAKYLDHSSNKPKTADKSHFRGTGANLADWNADIPGQTGGASGSWEPQPGLTTVASHIPTNINNNPANPIPQPGAPPTVANGSPDESYVRRLAKNTTLHNEGVTLTPYKDANGYSVGAGHFSPTLQMLPSHISTDQALTLFNQDYEKYALRASQLSSFSKLDPVRQGAIIDMAYNMGSVSDWKTLDSDLSVGNYDLAARDILHSKYASQVPDRAYKNALILQSGDSKYFTDQPAPVYSYVGGPKIDSVRAFMSGGVVPVPAKSGQGTVVKLEGGEWIIPRKDVAKLGDNNFQFQSSFQKFIEFINKSNPNLNTNKLLENKSNVKESNVNNINEIPKAINDLKDVMIEIETDKIKNKIKKFTTSKMSDDKVEKNFNLNKNYLSGSAASLNDLLEKPKYDKILSDKDLPSSIKKTILSSKNPEKSYNSWKNNKQKTNFGMSSFKKEALDMSLKNKGFLSTVRMWDNNKKAFSTYYIDK